MTGSALSNRPGTDDVPWPASGHDRDEPDYGLGEAVCGTVTTVACAGQGDRGRPARLV